MSEFVFNCPDCKAEIQAEESWAGGSAQCPGCGHSILIPMPGIRQGMLISGFKIVSRLGSGGMGEVWLAEQIAMDRQVALKILSPALTSNSEFVDRFMAEVKMSAKLHHPNVVTAFDAGNENGIYYLAISYIDGVELDDKLKIEGKIPEKDALCIVRSIAEALKYAWNKFKLLHRDIKPANIMIDNDGDAKLMDMGISKSMMDDIGLTMTGVVIGTPYYMSPEQARAEAGLDFRSDIYSLGATLYHILTGQVPYDATTAMGILTKLITEPFPNPREHHPELSDQCILLLEIMMAKDKQERQASWDDVMRDIDLVLRGAPPETSLPVGASTISTTISKVLDRKKLDESGKTPEHMARFHSDAQSEFERPERSRFFLSPTLLTLCAILLVTIMLGGGYLIGRKFAKRGASLVEGIFDEKSRAGKFYSEDEKAGEKNIPAEEAALPKEQAKKAPKHDEQRMRETWELSVDFVRKRPKMLEMGIANFKKIKSLYPGTKYAAKAELKINELKERARSAKRKSISNTLSDLQEKAKPYIAKKDFAKAAELFRKYAGKYKAETMEDRADIAQKYAKKARELKEAKERQFLKSEKKREDLLDSIASIVLRRRFAAALKAYNASALKSLMPNFNKTLTELTESNKIILKSMNTDKNIAIETPRGRAKVKVKRIKGSSIYYLTKIGKGYIQRKAALKDLTHAETMKRLSKLSKDARNLYAISLAVKAHKYDSALKCADELSSSLAKVFENQIFLMKLGKAEGCARNDYVALLRRNGFDKENVPSAEIKKEMKRKDLSPARREEMMEEIRIYQEKHGSSAFAIKHDKELEALKPPRIIDIQRLFSGKVLKFDQASLEITILYNFKLKKELRDWMPVKRRILNQSFYIKNGSLVLEASNMGAIFCLPKFSEFEAEFTGSFSNVICEVIMGGRRNIGFIIGAEGGRVDGYMRNMFGRGGDIKSVGTSSSFRPGSEVAGKLAWRNGNVKFSAGGKNWPSVPFDSPEARFGLALKRSSNRYSKILLRGKLARGWFEDALAKDENEPQSSQSSERSLEDVKEALKTSNPGYNGDGNFVVDGGQIVEISLKDQKTISDIRALKGLPLKKLELENTMVRDISPLRGMQLTTLDLFNAPVESLKPLEGMPLSVLQLKEAPLTDVSALKGMSLTVLWMINMRVKDVSVLKGMPLRDLSLYFTDIEDISCLAGMPLERLHIGATKIRDISPLKGMQIKELLLDHCRNLNDISTLQTLRGLERLTIPAHVNHIDFLRSMHNIKCLNTLYDEWKTTAEAFWKKREKNP